MKTAKELRAELAEAEAAERVAQDAQWREIRAKVNTLPWEWLVSATNGWQSDPEDAVYVERRRLIEDPIFAEEAAKVISEVRNFVGMKYYRTQEGILNHCGGGHHVLRTPMLCSDAEWASILNGVVPEKFHQRLGERYVK